MNTQTLSTFSVVLAAALSWGCTDDDRTITPDRGGTADLGARLDGELASDGVTGGADGAGGDSSFDGGASGCVPAQARYAPGCEPGGQFATIAQGCYQACTAIDDPSCPQDQACRQAWINPCVCDNPPPGTGCCAACGASTWLCLPKSTPYALNDLDASCDGKFTTSEALASLQSGYSATLTYANDAQAQLGLSLAFAAGTILCHPEQLAKPGMGMPDRPARIELPLALTLKTDDGNFDEAFETRAELMVGWGSFEHQMALAELKGAYRPSNDETLIAFSASLAPTSAEGWIRTSKAGTLGLNLGGWTTAK